MIEKLDKLGSEVIRITGHLLAVSLFAGLIILMIRYPENLNLRAFGALAIIFGSFGYARLKTQKLPQVKQIKISNTNKSVRS